MEDASSRSLNEVREVVEGDWRGESKGDTVTELEAEEEGLEEAVKVRR
jgi:hypothetical protein